MSKLKIAIDAGHGSNTAGKRTPPFKKSINGDNMDSVKKGEQYHEHYANVGIANLLYKNLINRGYEVIKTGWDDSNSRDDEDESLSSRQNKIKKAGCDCSVSIHFNASGSGAAFNNAKGFNVYIHSSNPADSRRLAEYALSELSKGTSQENRGINKDSLAMCNCSTMKTKASILCEIAFMTNEYEATNLMINHDFWAECAKELADAIDRFSGNSNIVTVVEKPKSTYQLFHTVQSGETLSQISSKYNVTVATLIKNNEIKNPDKIAVGKKLFIMKYFIYTVKSGETLSEISKSLLGNDKRYTEIMEINDLKTQTLYKNQQLKIPA